VSALVFDHPWVLAGLAVLIPLALGDWFSPRGKRVRKSLPGNLRKKLFASRVFFRLFLALLIIALAGPRWGIGQAADEYRRAIDAVIAIDVSRSMETDDGFGGGGGGFAGGQAGGISRLERGLSIVREAVEALPGMRFAVAISRNRGIVAIPLTWDSGAVLAFLDGAGSSMTGRGTNLESLVDAAAGAFQSSLPARRVILLVSDGEALSGSLNAALQRCVRDGITVNAIASGSDEGGIFPGGEGTVSRRDSAAMRMAAILTGGAYIDGNREDAARALIAHLRSLAQESKSAGNRKELKARWFIFIMTAIMAFGASKLSLLRTSGRERQ